MNKSTIICLLAICLLPSCVLQKICPAYQSAFILDENIQKEAYSLFTVFEGDTLPKRPYGFRFKADGDTLMEKFIKGTQGKGFRVQAGRVHSLEKSGFTYENRVKEKLFARLFRGKEKPVLENPYLFDRITKKKPFYKLDHIPMELVHYNGARHDSIVRSIVSKGDTALYDSLKAEMRKLPHPIQVQYAPMLRGGFNQEQAEYNKRFKDYFLRLPDPPEIDSAALELQADTTAVDSVKTKKGVFGLFGKKNKKDKPPKEKKEKKKKNRKNNEEGIKEEEENGNG